MAHLPENIFGGWEIEYDGDNGFLDQPRTPLLPFLRPLVKDSNDPIFWMHSRTEFTARSAIALTNRPSLWKIIKDFFIRIIQ